MWQGPALGPGPEVPVAGRDPVAGLAILERGLPRPKPIADYGETLARPVFFKSRAPYVPPPPAPAPVKSVTAPPPPPPQDPGLVLRGVVVVEEAKKAYIVNKRDQRGGWFSEGETILGWKVESIDSGTARLRQGDRAIELQLYPKR